MRKLRAIVVWTATGADVRNIEGFDIPPRTKVEMRFPVPPSPKPVGTVEETFVLISAFRCMDCSFETESFDLMSQHQKSGKHTP